MPSPGLCAALTRFGLSQVSRFETERWSEEAQLSSLEATRLAAAFDLGRRVEGASMVVRPLLSRAADVARYMQPKVRGLLRERFYVLVLDSSQRLVVVERISEGTLSTAPVHPREVYRPALRTAGASIVVAHNHPSGDAEPSQEDIEVTRRLIRAGELLGVPLLDHVVLGEHRWISLRTRIDFRAPQTVR